MFSEKGKKNLLVLSFKKKKTLKDFNSELSKKVGKITALVRNIASCLLRQQTPTLECV